MSAAIPVDEVVALLRRAIAGEVPLRLSDSAMPWSYWNNIDFKIGDWTICFFNDCGELDYCDNAIAPDGRKADYDDWCGGELWRDPITELSSEERHALEQMLEKAT